MTSKTHLPQGDFLFSLLGQKHVCDTGDEAGIKIHKKIKIGIPEIGTFFTKTFKYSGFEAGILGLLWEKYGLSSEIKNSTTSGCTLGDENVIGIRALNIIQRFP